MKKTNKAITIYSFLFCLFISLVGIFTAKRTAELLSSFIFVPLVFYFATKLFNFAPTKTISISPVKKNSESSSLAVQTSSSAAQPAAIQPEVVQGVTDNDKRLFLKLIGSTSLSIVLMSLFTKKAQASFFGSVPGPGVVSLKDSAGNKIDPAEKNPTDGYAITNIDDAATPVYYGFVKKTGAWYIMSQDSSGVYLYAKGPDDFSTSWDNRDHLVYDYFNTVFG